MKKILVISVVFGFMVSFAHAGNLKWEAWILGNRMMDLNVDNMGKIEGTLYQKGKVLASKYYYVGQDYTCGKNLKADFGADCNNTCFPSYKQKGIDFSLNLAPETVAQCKTSVEKSGLFSKTKYLGRKAHVYNISCPDVNITVTTVPEFTKYQALINGGTNNYFKTVLGAFKLEGMVAKVVIENLKQKKKVNFYEAKNVNLDKVAVAVAFPAGYRVIHPQPFLSKFEGLDKNVNEKTSKKVKTLYSKKNKEVKTAIAKVRKDCVKRFPAQKDKELLMEICRQDPQVSYRINLAMVKWQQNIRSELVKDSQTQFKAGMKSILENSCKK